MDARMDKQPWEEFVLNSEAEPWGRGDDGMVTYSGGVCHPTHPTTDEIRINDIAAQLGHICRFTGAVSRFYSVAQHCVLVSKLLPMDLKLMGLLHDTSEAYLNDIAKPWKSQLTEYKGFEDNMLDTIFQALKLPYSAKLHPLVKKADWMALAWEQKELLPDCDYWPHMLSDGDWRRLCQRYGRWSPMYPQEATEAFIKTYHSLRDVLEI